MRGIIFENPYTPTRGQALRLCEEFENLGTECFIGSSGFSHAHVWEGELKARYNGLDLNVYLDREKYRNGGKLESRFSDYDFCVYLDKDKYRSAALEKIGLRLFNRHEAIRLCDDKMSTHIALANAGVPMPETIAGLLCYDKDKEIQSLTYVERALGYPMIVKKCYGSLGSGVYKVDNHLRLYILADELKTVPHLFQKYIKESEGRDIRAIVIGGEVKAAMMRVAAPGEFRSNLALGGKGLSVPIDDEMREICRKVATILNLDYCGVDLLLSNDGYLVCEVNSNAFFEGIERVTGVNVARLYAEHILKTCAK